MGQINVILNGRSYTVACDDGEEEHLMELGEFVASRAEELAGSVGQVGDSRLMLMTSLVVADELGESLDRIDKLERELEVIKAAKRPLATGQPSEGHGEEDTQHLVEILNRATQRVQDIAARVAND
jgi:cell division protein ZapA